MLLLRQVAACALPTGGTLHSITLTLSGIHSTNIELFFLWSSYTANYKIGIRVKDRADVDGYDDDVLQPGDKLVSGGRRVTE